MSLLLQNRTSKQNFHNNIDLNVYKILILLNLNQRVNHKFEFLQESRPLGAVMVSGCNIVQGCEEEDEQTGVARQYAFRLKLNSILNKANVPVSLTSGNSNTIQCEEEEAKNSRYLCLAAESEGLLHKWLNTIAISSQAPDKVIS